MTEVIRAYNFFNDASNGEWLEARWERNVCQVGIYANGTGTARRLSIDVSSLDRLHKDDLALLYNEVQAAVIRRNIEEARAEGLPHRDAVNTPVQRNGPDPEPVKVYNTYTDTAHVDGPGLLDVVPVQGPGPLKGVLNAVDDCCDLLPQPDRPRNIYESGDQPAQAAFQFEQCAKPFLTVSADGRVTFSPDVTIDLDGLTVDWLRMVRALADEAIQRKLKEVP